MTIQENDTVKHEIYGEGEVAIIEGQFATVEFDLKVRTVLLNTLTKINEVKEAYMSARDRKALARHDAKPTHVKVHNALLLCQGKMYPSEQDVLIWDVLAFELREKLSDNAAVVDILTKMCPFTITDKQAWLIGYAAKNAGVNIENA